MNVKLIMFREDGSRREFSLGLGATTIGRKDDCTIRIPLAVVSRRHGAGGVEGEGAILRDLGGGDGTHRKNRGPAEKALGPGDKIGFGRVVFPVQVAGEPSDNEIL